MKTFVLLVLLSCTPTKNSTIQTLTGQSMGTTYTIKWYGVENNAINNGVKEAVDSIDKLMSTYKSDSEVSRFNTTEGQDIKISEDTYRVLALANEIHQLTGGAFDITVNPLKDLWENLFKNRLKIYLPKPIDIESTLKKMGQKHLKLIKVDDHYFAGKRINKLSIDLSAIAKGYANDKVAKFFESNNIFDYMIEIGGEIRVGKKNTKLRSWRLAIERPHTLARKIHAIIQMDNGAMATSGNYRNYVEIEGKYYSHILDPRTGYPVTPEIISATVIDNSTARADALATAFSVMGLKKAMKLAEKLKIPVYFIAQIDGKMQTFYTDSIRPYLVE